MGCCTPAVCGCFVKIKNSVFSEFFHYVNLHQGREFLHVYIVRTGLCGVLMCVWCIQPPHLFLLCHLSALFWLCGIEGEVLFYFIFSFTFFPTLVNSNFVTVLLEC